MNKEEIQLAQKLIEDIKHKAVRSIRLMEFCGGHTVAILKHGIRQFLPDKVWMFSGPGCPVCVTATADIDKIIELSRSPEVIIASFGDLLRVPGSKSSLQQSRAQGNDIRIVYSSLEALDLAVQNPAKTVIMIGIGFETTAPTIAASILEAEKRNIRNYKVLSLHKLTPPIIKAILDAGEIKLDGIVCPGHVCTITGSNPYAFIPKDYGIACAVAGFEPLDILIGIDMIVTQIYRNKPDIEIAYSGAVRSEGNTTAQKLMDNVFEVTRANWRGIGEVDSSGLSIRSEYQDFDASAAYSFTQIESREPQGCICGEILRGIKTPVDCSLFGTACTPEHPVGPCMVSSEGACSAFNLYGEM